MKACNEKATGKKGDVRKEYMSACLAGKEPAKKLTVPSNAWSTATRRRTGKSGDDRKKFMSECLKAKT